MFQSARNLQLGAKEYHLPAQSSNVKSVELLHEYVDLVVCGSHMKGLPLNRQLTEIGGKFVKQLKTKPLYNLYDISTASLKRPGMIRNSTNGAAIDVEIWRIPRVKAGEFLDRVKAPLVLGTVELEDGTSQKGFLCESYVAEKATDITSYGGWRAYIGSR